MIKCVLIIHILSCFLGSGKLYIWYPNKLVFAVAKCPLTPIYMGGLRPCLFSKRQPQKLSHIKPPTPESSGAPSPVGRSKKWFFDKPKGYFCECVNSLNSHFMDQQKPLTHSVAIYH